MRLKRLSAIWKNGLEYKRQNNCAKSSKQGGQKGDNDIERKQSQYSIRF
jgi:hypothetical protein